MKKILLFGILVISTLVFGEINSDKINEKELQLKAEVSVPLTVEIEKEINFGVIIKGDTKPRSAQGSLIISGIPKEAVVIYVKNVDKYVRVKNHEERYTVELKKIGSSGNESQNSKITAYINLNPEEVKFSSDKGSFELTSEGKRKVELWGVITSLDKDLAIGDYQGYLYVKAQYE